MKVAIIGAGISGLSAAYAMRQEKDVHVFESSSYVGGHAHTVSVYEGDHQVDLDIGFMVYNEDTYPGFSGLLETLDVRTQPSDMSFAVSCEGCGLEFGTRGLRGILAQPANLLRPSRLKAAAQLVRFYREARALRAGDEGAETTLGEFLEHGRYSEEFRRHGIVPLISSVWSTPASMVSDFPARYLFDFMANHGILSLDGRRAWRTVVGGSTSYIDRLVDALPNRVRTGTPAKAVWREDQDVIIESNVGIERFDAVVLATHADQSLHLLADPTRAEREALSSIKYSASKAVLHLDTSVMARRRAAWGSWNYRTARCTLEPEPLSVTYHLNRLQQFGATRDYFVTMNPRRELKPGSVIQELSLAHPVYSKDTLSGQRMIRALNGLNRTFYAGAYMGYGFHEDGYRSGLEVAGMIGEEVPRLVNAESGS